MTATYDATTIGTNLISYARSRFRDVAGLVGTTVTKPLMFDEEYQGLVDRLGAREGLAQAAEALAANYAQRINHFAQSGDVDVTWPNRPDFYLKLAQNIRTYGVEMSAGGVYAGRPITPSPLNDKRLLLEPYWN